MYVFIKIISVLEIWHCVLSPQPTVKWEIIFSVSSGW